MSEPPARSVADVSEDAAPEMSGFSDIQAGARDAAKEAAGEAVGEAGGEADLDALFGSDCRELRKLFSIGC